jgi:hypothetical protein
MNNRLQLFFLLSALTVKAAVVPEGLTLIEGNSGSSMPFNSTGVRFQQVYAASAFEFEAPGWIRGLAFRVDGSPGGGGMPFFGKTLPNVQINLSTTLRQPDSLTPVFADNVGFNDTIVRSGPLSIQGSITSPGPNSFDIGIPLTTPFFYNPAQGNLLLEVRNFMGTSTSPFDAVNTSGDSVSTLFASGADSTFGNVSTIGLVTWFTIDPVPEPSTWALVGIGFLLFGVYRHVRPKSKNR